MWATPSPPPCRCAPQVVITRVHPLSQEEQARCFRNAAAHLTDDGVSIVEGGMTFVGGP